MNTKTKRISATIIASLFVATNTIAVASEISGINAVNGVYNISPQSVLKGRDVGLRTYKDFNLDKGDIANLNYKHGDKNINTFVNLVDNKININGIVNSVRGENYYKGNAVFVSPKGMVVGNSGVINVGSLTVHTPKNDVYENLKANPDKKLSGLSDINKDSIVEINGKILTTGNVEINSGLVNINKSATVISGHYNPQKLTTNPEDAVFNYTVNTGNKQNGDIIIRSNSGTNINGTVRNNNNGEILIVNSGKYGINVNNGSISARGGNISLTNHDGGVYINGTLDSGKDITIENKGYKGIEIDEDGVLRGNADINIHNHSHGSTNIKGIVRAKNDINLYSENNNIEIGNPKGNENFVNAGNDINIEIDNGSLLNNGTDKTLLKAANDLNVKVTDGTIGRSRGNLYDSKRNSWTQKGSWSYKDSINGDIKGNVSLNTSSENSAKSKDLSIDYTAKGSDMRINRINAAGKVTLIADDENKVLNITKANPNDKQITNITSDDITIISNGNIGKKGNSLTFDQYDGKMNILANGDINIKAQNDSHNRNSEVSNLISRNGSIDAEFGGNTYIKNTTAEKDLKIVTRGRDLTIEKLGHTDTSTDYFGVRNNGKLDGGYTGTDYATETLPDKVTLKALDINPYLTNENHNLATYYNSNPNSTVRVKDAVLDNGKMDITADNIYANGVHVHLGPNGMTKEQDNSTNIVIGSDGAPMGHAVKPEDVEEVGRYSTMRKYYTNEQSANETVLELDDGKKNLDSDNDTDNDLDTDTDVDTDSDIDTDIDSDTDNDTDLDSDTDNDNDTGNNYQESDTDTDIDNDIDVDTDTDIDDDTDDRKIDLDYETDSDTDNDTDLDTDTDNGIDYESETDNYTENDPLPESDTDIDNDIDIDTDTDIDYDNDTEKAIDLDYITDSDTDSDTDLDTDTDMDFDTDYFNDLDKATKDKSTDTDKGKATDTDKDKTTNTDTHKVADADTDMDVDIDSDIDSDLDIDLDIDIDDDIDTDIDMDDDTDIGAIIESPVVSKTQEISTQKTQQNTTQETQQKTQKENQINKVTDNSVTYTPVNNLTNTTDKRRSVRFNTSRMRHSVTVEKQDRVDGLIDISRGGVGLRHNNRLKAGDVLPIHIKYKDMDIVTDVLVLSVTKSRAGARFTNLDSAKANKILYMNIMLESDNDMLVTSLK